MHFQWNCGRTAESDCCFGDFTIRGSTSANLRQAEWHVFFSLLFEQTTVQVYNQILSKFNSAQLIFMRFLAPVPGIWRIVAEPVRLADGIFHLWLPMKEFLTGNVIFLDLIRIQRLPDLGQRAR